MFRNLMYASKSNADIIRKVLSYEGKSNFIFNYDCYRSYPKYYRRYTALKRKYKRAEIYWGFLLPENRHVLRKGIKEINEIFENIRVQLIFNKPIYETFIKDKYGYGNISNFSFINNESDLFYTYNPAIIKISVSEKYSKLNNYTIKILIAQFLRITGHFYVPFNKINKIPKKDSYIDKAVELFEKHKNYYGNIFNNSKIQFKRKHLLALDNIEFMNKTITIDSSVNKTYENKSNRNYYMTRYLYLSPDFSTMPAGTAIFTIIDENLKGV